MRLGFIGRYGHHYMRHLLNEPGAGQEYSVAVAGDGHSPENPSELAGSISNSLERAPYFQSPLELLDQFRPDAVSIGAMYGYNGDIIASALERDIAVVSDKPIAATWQQLDRLRALTHDNNRVLLTEFPFRSQPEFRAARAAVRSGCIGEVILATAQKSYRFGASRPAWYGNRQSYGGTMLWVASHGIDVLRFVAGQKFKRVIGVQGNLSRPDYAEFEDHCVALFEMANGASAVVHADYLRPEGGDSHGDDRLRIAGSQGIVEVRGGRCLLLAGSEPETDISASVEVLPMQRELLAALRGENHEYYSTCASLEMAEVLLHARDAADAAQWMQA